ALDQDRGFVDLLAGTVILKGHVRTEVLYDIGLLRVVSGLLCGSGRYRRWDDRLGRNLGHRFVGKLIWSCARKWWRNLCKRCDRKKQKEDGKLLHGAEGPFQ